ncbi:unnamed protein product [Owenia fusiformis]|uniref:Uncharacterized protein n=1 Tax=Owenia fusiformis TaxID=6347 RepID=A0A8J1TZ00_OWEFU|nr:unnamed protein product [Owenia fusiformis]
MSLTLIRLNCVLECLWQHEENVWRSIDLGSEDGSGCLTPGVGAIVLKHGSAVRNIHGYFSNLDCRKCCLSLAGCPNVDGTMRPVEGNERDSGIVETHNALLSSSNNSSDFLNEDDLQLFKHVLLCAQFPVLGAPDPPSGITPTPLPHHSRHSQIDIAKSSRAGVVISPSSGIDTASDLEDSAACIQAETLCEILRQSLKLSKQRTRHYESKAYEQYGRKQLDRILVEELANQLSLLERNCHPYYSVSNFQSSNAYDRWQQSTRRHITALIAKFWHSTVPSHHKLGDDSYEWTYNNVHRLYKQLLQKLINYEKSFEVHRGRDSKMVLLSSASGRLLQEFALRYGVDDSYRKLVYLEHVVDNFEATPQYIEHVCDLVKQMMYILTTQGGTGSLVKSEVEMLKESTSNLFRACRHHFVSMKTSFECNRPGGGVESLMRLLGLVLQLRHNLFCTIQKPITEYFQQFVKEGCYERYSAMKQSAMEGLEIHNNDITPKLVNTLIFNLRDEIQDYKTNFTSTFERYFDISSVCGQILYNLLMIDVQCLDIPNNSSVKEIDLQYVGLAHRLNTLDMDWAQFINPVKQTWRHQFSSQILNWLDCVRYSMGRLTLQSIGMDKFTDLDIPSKGSLSSGQRSRTVSIGSLTPSLNSAFDNYQVSNSSTPTSAQHNEPSNWVKVSQSIPVRLSITERPNANTNALSNAQDIDQGDQINTEHKERHKRSLNEIRVNALMQPQRYSSSSGFEDNYGFARPVSSLSLNFEPTLTGITDDAGLSHSLGSAEDEDHLNHHLSPNRFSFSSPSLDSFQPEATPGSNHTFRQQSSPSSLPSPEHQYLHVDISEVRARSASPLTSTQVPLNEDIRQQEPINVSAICEVIGHIDMDSDSDTIESEIAGCGSPYPDLSVLPKPKAVKQHTGLDDNNEYYTKETNGNCANNGRRTPMNIKHYAHSPNNNTMQSKDTFQQKETFQRKDMIQSPGTQILKKILPTQSTQNTPKSTNPPVQPTGQKRQTVSPSSSDVSTLLVSGSLLDTIVMFNRMINFSQTMCNTICPMSHNDNESYATSATDSTMQTNTNMGTGDNKDTAATNTQDRMQEIMFTRKSIYEKVLQLLSRGVHVYGMNILCMDACGMMGPLARKLLGDQLVDDMVALRGEKLIWGCRHMARGDSDCLAYTERKSKFIADKHEPIDHEMCMRICNTATMLEVLPVFKNRAIAALEVSRLSALLRNMEPPLSEELSKLMQEYAVIDTFQNRYHAGSSRSTPTTESSGSSNLSLGGSTDILLADVIFGECKHKLEAILAGQINILAYRINLFFRDTLHFLLALDAPYLPLDIRLRPLTEFLTNHWTALGQWLYSHLSHRVTIKLWEYIVKDFENEALNVCHFEGATDYQAELVSQSLAFFLKMFYKEGQKVDLDTLTSKVSGVTFILELYSFPSRRLVSLYYQMCKQDASDSEMPPVRTPGLPASVLEKMKRSLHAIRKCFTGKQLVDWVVNNVNENILHNVTGSAIRNRQSKRHSAMQVGQMMLAQEVLLNVDDDAPSSQGSRSNSESEGYPEVTLLRRPMSSGLMSVGHDRDDSDTDTDVMKGSSPEAGERRDNESKRFSIGTPVCSETYDAMNVSTSVPQDTDSSDSSSSYSSDVFYDCPERYYCFATILDNDVKMVREEISHETDQVFMTRIQFDSQFKDNTVSNLVTKCNEFNIKPEYILGVLFSRRYDDDTVKCFLEWLPDDVLDKLWGRYESTEKDYFGCFG